MNSNLHQLDPDLNYEDLFNSTDVCKYYTVEAFNNTVSNNLDKCISMICFNIRSFNKNHDEFLGFLSNCNLAFDIIVLTETWARDETQSLNHLSGYIPYHNYRDERKGGGVSVYVNESLHADHSEIFNISNDNIEGVGINLSMSNSSFFVSILGLYRQPKGNKMVFLDTLDDLLNSNNISRRNTIITGDFNICLLKEEMCDFSRRLINTMHSLHFHPAITKPTRIDKNNYRSLIDHIWSNNELISCRGILLADITDHYPIFCGISVPVVSKDNTIQIKFRDMSATNERKFSDSLSDIDWTALINNPANLNPHQSTELFINEIDRIYNNCFPMKTKCLSVMRINSPWLSKGLLKSIDTKHSLYKRVKLGLYDINYYKFYCNRLTSLIRIAKHNYFTSKFDQLRADVKNTWKLINTTLRPNKNRRKSFKNLIYNGNVISDPQQIANNFNQHFSSIGDKLEKAIPAIDHLDFHNFLPPSNPHSIYLSPSTPAEVISLAKK